MQYLFIFIKTISITGTQAANDLFKDEMYEYTGVDNSLDQLRMARFVVTGGHPDVETPGIRFKKNLPEGLAFAREQYSVVLCSHTLGDVPVRKDRIKLLDKLWGKVHYQGGCLVLIESGGVPGTVPKKSLEPRKSLF